MQLNSKNRALIILGATALVCSRIMFALFDDPEGPNLLIVVVMAAVIYAPSFVVYSRNKSTKNSVKLLWAILLQIILVAVALPLLKII